jgi:predicted NAD-dependent protein-ADP-ribosyltransferase YbiA (DUF1768 family)
VSPAAVAAASAAASAAPATIAFGKPKESTWGVLSNMSTEGHYDWGLGLRVTTAEASFQGRKALLSSGDAACLRVAAAIDGYAARQAGKALTLNNAWDAVAEEAMLAALYYKYAPGTDALNQLMATGDAVLLEAAPWDPQRIWGCGMRLPLLQAALKAGTAPTSCALGRALASIRMLRHDDASYDVFARWDISHDGGATWLGPSPASMMRAWHAQGMLRDVRVRPHEGQLARVRAVAPTPPSGEAGADGVAMAAAAAAARDAG